MIRIILKIYQKVIESFWMEWTITSVYPAFNAEFFSFRSVSGLKKLLHPACRCLCLLKVKLFCVNNFFHRDIAVMRENYLCVRIEFVNKSFNLRHLIFRDQIGLVENNYIGELNLIDKKLA